MKDIWSAFVKDTQNLEQKPEESGTPLTDQHSEPISADDRVLMRGLLHAATLLIKDRGVQNPWVLSVRGKNMRVVVRPVTYRWFFRVVSVYDRVIHMFGVHTMLPHDQWSPVSGEVLDVGFTCVLCPYEDQG